MFRIKNADYFFYKIGLCKYRMPGKVSALVYIK